MKNWEFYEEKWKSFYKDDTNFYANVGINKDGELEECNNCECENCKLYNKKTNNCISIVEYLYQEHKEPIRELSNFERELLKRCLDNGYKWIARDRNSSLIIHEIKPIEEENCWISLGSTSFITLIFDTFDFVKWEDTEPTNIEELLKENYNKGMN